VYKSSPSSDEVKSKWSYTSTPAICLLGAEEKKIIFNFHSYLSLTTGP
jgi:hypothetical protein